MAKIVWTREATRELQMIIAYLQSNWSKAIAEEFVGNLYTKIRLLQDTPETGIASYEYAHVRRLLIARNSVLYYQAEDDNIVILNVFNLLSSADEPLFSDM